MKMPEAFSSKKGFQVLRFQSLPYLGRVEFQGNSNDNPDHRSCNDPSILVSEKVRQGYPEGKPDCQSQDKAYPLPDGLVGCSPDSHDEDDRVKDQQRHDDD